MAKPLKLTEEQAAAVDFPHNRPAVVTAAAGSGKTTLLVERIIRLISDANNPINAASLAIMTFTVNATQSIRAKLNSALQSRISELSNINTKEAAAEKNYLSEQIINLRSASISTINAFCLGIIRENFQKFDLPINFTIADETKKTSMQWSAEQLAKQDFYDESSENGFSSEERDTLFYMFEFEDDKKLFDSVIRTAEYLSSYGNVEKWLDKAAQTYSSMSSLEEKYIGVYVDYLGKLLKKLQNNFAEISDCICRYKAEKADETNEKKRKSSEEAVESLICYANAEKNRLETIEKDYADLCQNPSMDALQTLLDNANKTPENKEKISAADRQNPIRKQITVYRNAFKEAYSEILKIGFSKSEEERSFPEQQVAVRTFARLVKRYASYYSDIKRTQGCIDFSDCELLLLEKLQNDEDFRNQLSQRFSCIIVDEFQDSNNVQAEIFRLLGNGNLFYVGDVKQSIYAFRGGNPTIMAQLSKGDDGFTALPLNKNFRSRKQVIDVVNAAFNGLMTEEYGGVDYENGNRLEYGADYPELSEENEEKFCAELYALDFDKSSSESEMQSARFTAGIIKELMEDENFFITKNGEAVRPSYSDFIILMRKNGKIKQYRDALAELNIPAISPKGRNFLLSEEIKLIINLLKIIDNPLRDEETLNVLMSPLYRFTAEEIAELKLGVLGFPNGKLSDDETKIFSACTKKSSLYRCLSFCTKSLEQKKSGFGNNAEELAEKTEKSLLSRGISRVINPKADAFLRDLEGFRYFMSNNSTDNLIRRIYDETDIFAVVSAYDDSRRRISNLRRLETIASDFVSRECGTLSDFIRFLEKSMQNNRDIEEAATPEDAANSVRIMTFHASKGLEAPICILAELNEQINIRDYTGSFLINHDYYFSMDYVDRKNRFREKTFSGYALQMVNRKKPIGEELRLLYVAMTRAQEKLIMIGQFSEKTLTEITAKKFNPNEIFGGTVPFRWILSSLMRECTVTNDNEFSFKNIPLKLHKISDAPSAPEYFEEDENDFEVSDEEAEELVKLITKPYSYLDETRRQAKFSVTELAHRNKQIPFTLTKPAFALSGKKSGADFGNAYHHCMEHISLEAVRNSPENELSDNIAAELCRLCDEGKITEDEMSCIDAEIIAGFFTSDLGKRLLRSSHIEREFPFYAEIEGSEIDKNLSGVVGIQGRIDACFEENGELVVIDYKTDFDINAEKDAYEKQVKIYAKILPMLLGKSVSQTYLYSFTNGEEILL